MKFDAKLLTEAELECKDYMRIILENLNEEGGLISPKEKFLWDGCNPSQIFLIALNVYLNNEGKMAVKINAEEALPNECQNEFFSEKMKSSLKVLGASQNTKVYNS